MAQARIVGALASPDGKAPFERAFLVVEGPKGVFVGDDEGEPFPLEEWKALLKQREAIRLDRAPSFEPGLRLWMFRGDFTMDIDGIVTTLSRAKLWVADSDCWPHDKRRGFVRDGQCNGFREAWASAALEGIERTIRIGDIRYALACAQTAFHLEPRMTPRATALLSYVFRLSGNIVRAEGYVQSAERSFGAEFVEMVRTELDRFEEHKR